jgi:hypothetical protein
MLKHHDAAKPVMMAASGAEQEARAVTGPKPISVQGRSNRALQRRLRLRHLARSGHGCRFRLRPFPEVAVTFSAGTITAAHAADLEIGQGEWIRTTDLLLPRQAGTARLPYALSGNQSSASSNQKHCRAASDAKMNYRLTSNPPSDVQATMKGLGRHKDSQIQVRDQLIPRRLDRANFSRTSFILLMPRSNRPFHRMACAASIGE